ncbi:MAG: ABC transporter permease, partial [Acidobacteriota bacterium]
MTVPWRKAVRDVGREGMRSVLVVAAMALGIAGFTALLATDAILTRELDRGYLETNPASATLFTDAVDEGLLREIRSGHGVSDAEGRRVVSARIRVGTEWRALRLFVVADYGKIRIGRLVPEKGAWPPGRGEMLIERDAFQVAKARIGDTVTVRTPRGVERTLRVAGGVHDVGQAQARMENAVYGYITLATLSELGEESYLDQIQILAAVDRANEKHVHSVAADVRRLVESRGHPVRRMDVPKPGRHPHADIMGMLLLSLATFGLCVLALSGILVVNLMTAVMGSQVRQIGVMKTIGGSRAQIIRIYLAEAAVLGAAAIAVALPAGILGSRALCRSMAVFLNFDVTSFAVPLRVYLLVAAVGLLVPILAAAWPVWKGSG